MRWARAAAVAVLAAAAAVAGMSLAAANGRPDPGPCRDMITVELSASAICAAPEAPAWLVLGAGAVSAVLVAAIAIVVLRRTSVSATRSPASGSRRR